LYGIEILKTDVSGVALGGAKFRIYTDATKAQADISSSGSTTTGALVDTNSNILEVQTETDGKATIYGLEPGTYYLVETTAPAGYNKLTAPVTVTVNDSMAAAYLVDVTVTNSAEFVLPITGGTGTILFTVVGLLLIGGAGVFLIISKRRRNQNA